MFDVKTLWYSDESLISREECLLTKITYFRLGRRLLARGIVLPEEKKYREGAAKFRPKLEKFSLKEGEDPIGVKANFLDCLVHTFREIMEVVEKKNPQFQAEVNEGGEPRKLYATVKYGESENHKTLNVASLNCWVICRVGWIWKPS